MPPERGGARNTTSTARVSSTRAPTYHNQACVLNAIHHLVVRAQHTGDFARCSANRMRERVVRRVHTTSIGRDRALVVNVDGQDARPQEGPLRVGEHTCVRSGHRGPPGRVSLIRHRRRRYRRDVAVRCTHHIVGRRLTTMGARSRGGQLGDGHVRRVSESGRNAHRCGGDTRS
jgi:hypothetical protein